MALGNKCVIDPQEIQVFTRQRTAVRRECLAVGTRFLSGFIVPKEKAQALLDRIAEMEADFSAARTQFLAKFDRMMDDWVAVHPAWEHLIRDTGVTQEVVARRLSFAVQAFQIIPPPDVTHPGLANATAGLADTLFYEVSQLARETLEKSYLGKTAVTRRALRPLLTLQHKLEGLAFLDRRVRPIVQSIQGTLAALPRQGAIQDRDLQALIGLLSILEDPQRLKAHGDQLLELQANGEMAVNVAVEPDPIDALPPDEIDEAREEETSRVVTAMTVTESLPLDTGQDWLNQPSAAEAAVPSPPHPERSPVNTETTEPGNWFF